MNVLTSRLTQLVARGVSKVSILVAGVFGVEAIDDNTSVAIAGLIVSGVISLAAGAWDLYIHKQKTGGVLKPAGTPTPPKETT